MATLFKRTPEEAAGGCLAGADPIFNPAQCLSVLCEADPEKIAEILPPPLKPYKKPYVIFTYNNFRTVSFDRGLNGSGYRSTQLLIPATYDGVVGNFVAAQICSSDMCTLLGREKYGYPKKVGTVEHYEEATRFVGHSARHGIPFCILEADLDQAPNDSNFLKELGEACQSDPSRPDWAINWTFKTNWGRNNDVFDGNPCLVKGWKYKSVNAPSKIGVGKVTLIPSVDDPWFELTPTRVLGAVLSEVDSHMTCGYEEGWMEYFEVDKEAYLPYAFYGYDPISEKNRNI